MIHFFDDTPHHNLHMIPFFRKINGINQKFVIRVNDNDNVYSEIDRNDLVFVRSIWDYYKQLSIAKNDKIYFHSLMYRKLLPVLLLSKSYSNVTWVCWGADLHRVHDDSCKKIISTLCKYLYITLGCKFERIITLNHGDMRIAKKHIAIKKSLVLPYPLLGVESLCLSNKKIHGVTNIFVGNSAAKSNNHLEVLDSIKGLAGKNVLIYAPLSYAGEKDYINKVKSCYFEVFGDKFIPIEEKLTKIKYDELLDEMDVFLFAHNRQQGLYVAYYALLKGKKLYLKSDSSSYQEFKMYGLEIEDFYQLANHDIFKINETVVGRSLNNEIITNNFLENALIKKWENAIIELSYD